MPLALAGVLLLAVMFTLTAYAMAALSRYHASGILGYLQKFLTTIVKAVILTPLEIIGFTRWLAHEYGGAFIAAAKQTIGFVWGVGMYVAELQQAVFVTMPYHLLKFAYRLIYHELPLQIGAAAKPIGRVAHAARVEVIRETKIIYRQAKAVPRIAEHAAAVAIPWTTAPYIEQWRWLKKHWKAVLGAAGLAGLAGVAGEMPYGRTIKSIRRRLSRIEKYSLGGLAAGALAIGLARIGLGWARCNNVGRMGRALCRTPGNLLNDLLGILADIWVLENICVLIGPLESSAQTIGTPMVAALTAVGAGLCAGNIGAPAALSGPAVTVPSLYLGAALAA